MKLRFLLATAFTLAAQIAQAHAILKASSPSDNQTIRSPAVPIELQFNSRIDVRHSRLWIAPLDQADVALPLDETAPSNTLKSEANDLQNGYYRLRWQVLSVDGHITRGEILFRVSR